MRILTEATCDSTQKLVSNAPIFQCSSDPKLTWFCATALIAAIVVGDSTGLMEEAESGTKGPVKGLPVMKGCCAACNRGCNRDVREKQKDGNVRERVFARAHKLFAFL